MLFSSIPFLFWFLPGVLILYAAAPGSLKNTVLLLSSLFFYGWGEPRYVIWMMLAILMAYIFGLLIERYQSVPKLARLFLALSVSSSLLMLGYFKYADFFIRNVNAVTGCSISLLNITLPIGISFYTFQILSYTVDVYRQDVKAQRNLIDLAAYVALFPQLIAGPIVRYSDIAEQLKGRIHTMGKTAQGIRRFILGLGKKILIANLLGELCSIFRASDDKSVLFFWLYAVAYTLHVYFDFSGYSDMAIGLGLCFGFHFKENFNYPYISASIQEFWRRWHISLSTWFREYLYIPLGGNRKGKAKTYWNKLIVFFCTGLWHGANWTFIVWGLWHGFFIVAEDAVKKLFGLEKHGKGGRNPACAVLKHLYTLLVVLVGFVIFRADNMGQAFSMIGAMFSGGSASAQTGLLLAQCLTPLTLFVLAVGLVGSTPVLPLVCRKAEQQTGSVYACLQALSYAGVLALLLVDILHLSAASYVPFIYFQF